jgi:hypothetical protein
MKAKSAKMEGIVRGNSRLVFGGSPREHVVRGEKDGKGRWAGLAVPTPVDQRLPEGNPVINLTFVKNEKIMVMKKT